MASVTRFEPLDDRLGMPLRESVRVREETGSSASFDNGILSLTLPTHGNAKGTTLAIS